ncbi:MAG: SUMF1/EgtB/PvdO family nonheme iron enzyme, partial [Aquidulcibacter sp.]|nr:SUMF1/EgtB/PvdO family nonheme iron enzyme [Aquidulcibacter sp.]
NDGRALEAQLLDLSRSGISIDSVIRLLPRGKYWAEQSWLIQLLEDYKGAEYARDVARFLTLHNQPVFKHCSDCPTMVVLPSGSFTMGSPGSEAGRYDNEGPQRSVRIGYEFAVGKFEVTWSQYSACVSAGACPAATDDRFGQGNRPVTNVGWNYAQTYIAWLNQKTGLTGSSDRYRLLTKAEWEYAARAGSQARWSFGEDESSLGNYAWYDSNSGNLTHPVGSKTANGFGLHDMHGNVEEWLEDCYGAGYSVQPSDGSAFVKSPCYTRVVRGGSWRDLPQWLRSTYRDSANTNGFRSNTIGFRLARTLR